MLTCFLDHRREIVIRRTVYELKKAKEKEILSHLKQCDSNFYKSVLRLIGDKYSTLNSASLNISYI